MAQAREKSRMDADLLPNAPSPTFPNLATDRRDCIRYQFEIPVYFLINNDIERKGTLIDIAPTGVRVKTQKPPQLNTNVVLFISQIGRFAGRVTRSEYNYFAIEMSIGDAKSDRLKRAIWHYFQSKPDEAEPIEHQLSRSGRQPSVHHTVAAGELLGSTADGVTFFTEITKSSADRLEIVTDADLHIGQNVMIGNIAGTVLRPTQKGFTIKRHES